MKREVNVQNNFKLPQSVRWQKYFVTNEEEEVNLGEQEKKSPLPTPLPPDNSGWDDE